MEIEKNETTKKRKRKNNQYVELQIPDFAENVWNQKIIVQDAEIKFLDDRSLEEPIRGKFVVAVSKTAKIAEEMNLKVGDILRTSDQMQPIRMSHQNKGFKTPTVYEVWDQMDIIAHINAKYLDIDIEVLNL